MNFWPIILFGASNLASSNPALSRTATSRDSTAPAKATAEATQDCDAFYYGLGRTKDLTKAFSCYQSQGSNARFRLLTMVLNGEGRPYKSQTFEAEWKKVEDKRNSEAIKLKKAFDERQAGGKAPSRLDFCRDVAAYLLTDVECGVVEERKAELARVVKLTAIGKELAPAAQKVLSKLENDFKVFSKAEVVRIARERTGSTAYHLPLAQAIYLREHYEEDLRLREGKRELPLAKADEFKAADAELNRIYNILMEEAYRDKDGLKLAQRAWIIYRDSWVTLVSHLNGGGEREEASLGIKTQITRDRIAELSYNIETGETLSFP